MHNRVKCNSPGLDASLTSVCNYAHGKWTEANIEEGGFSMTPDYSPGPDMDLNTFIFEII